MKSDRDVVTAWAEYCNGPGWNNSPIWVLVRDESGSLSIDCIQPEDQSPEQLSLYLVSSAVNVSMVRAEIARARKARK